MHPSAREEHLINSEKEALPRPFYLRTAICQSDYVHKQCPTAKWANCSGKVYSYSFKAAVNWFKHETQDVSSM